MIENSENNGSANSTNILSHCYHVKCAQLRENGTPKPNVIQDSAVYFFPTDGNLRGEEAKQARQYFQSQNFIGEENGVTEQPSPGGNCLVFHLKPDQQPTFAGATNGKLAGTIERDSRNIRGYLDELRRQDWDKSHHGDDANAQRIKTANQLATSDYMLEEVRKYRKNGSPNTSLESAHPIENDPIITDMINAALTAASRAIRLRRDNDLKIEIKPDGSLVTKADKEAQLVIKHQLSHYNDNIGFMGEEKAEYNSQPQTGKQWVVDPIDGTKPFIYKTGEWGVSIGLQENGESTHAVLYIGTPDDDDPVHLKGKLYIAKQGEGAKVASSLFDKNNLEFTPLTTPKQVLPRNIYLGNFIPDINEGSTTIRDRVAQLYESRQCNEITCATAQMMDVVEGRQAGYVHGRHFPWDTAAATLIAKEAGASVYEAPNKSEPSTSTAAVFNPVHQEIMDNTTRLLHEVDTPTNWRSAVGNRTSAFFSSDLASPSMAASR